MRIPEGEPFEVQHDNIGQEKPFSSVMGRNNTFSPDHLFAQQHNPNENKTYQIPAEDLPEGIAPTEYPSDLRNSTRLDYDEFDPYKPGNRERVINSYGIGIRSTSPDTPTSNIDHISSNSVAPSESTEVFSAE